MGASYKQCDECGKRALSIATRCPGCGREFQSLLVPEEPVVPRMDLGRLISPNAIAGIIAVVVLVAAADLFTTVQRPDQPTSYTETATGVETEAGIETGTALATESASAMGATAPLDTASVLEVTADTAGELRIARTWTHVRKSRSKGANLEAVLMPGDTVYADSLDRAWYRVALEGEVLGYAHRSTLAAAGVILSESQ